MKQDIIRNFIACAVVALTTGGIFCPTPLFAESQKVDDVTWHYYVDYAGNVTISGADYRSGQTLVIPATIGGHPVKNLAHMLFSDTDGKNISIILPDTLEYIECMEGNMYVEAGSWTQGAGCFGPFNSNRLKSIAFASGSGRSKNGRYFIKDDMLFGVTEMEGWGVVTNLIAFAGFGKANKTIVVPDGVVGICANVFEDCEMVGLSFPASLSTLGGEFGGGHVFGWCSKLKSITIRGENPYYSVVRGCLIDRRTKTVVRACNGATIPADGSVERISVWAFSGWRDKTLTIPDSVHTIAESAFNDSDITSLYIGPCVTNICRSAFSEMCMLKAFYIDPENETYSLVNDCIVRKSDKAFVSGAFGGNVKRCDIPFLCERYCADALKDQWEINAVVFPRDIEFLPDNEYFWHGITVYTDVEKWIVAGCMSENEIYMSNCFASFMSSYNYDSEIEEMDDYPWDFTILPQCAVCTEGLVAATGSGRYRVGTKVTLSATPVYPAATVVWESEKGETIGNGQKYSFTMPSSDLLVKVRVVNPPELKISIATCGEVSACGTVSGAGAYAVGKKAALKAAADKNSVFIGWYDGDKLLSQSASCSYVMPDVDMTLTAKFATKMEDVDSLKVSVTNVTASAAGELAMDLSDTNLVSSLTLPKLTVTGLPAGLKYDAKTMKIAGKATKPGVYTVTVKATNASVTKAQEFKFDITVPNLVPELFKDAGYAADGVYELAAGAAPDLSDVIQAVKGEGWKLAVTGLPAGLKYDDKNSAVTGVATKEGSYTVTITATKGKEKEIATATFRVEFPTLTVERTAFYDMSATNGAKVVGGGKCPVGAKVSLKATPGKNGVFVGWCDADGNPLTGGAADYRNATYAYVATDADVTLVAMFATKQEDIDSLKVTVLDDAAASDGSFALDLGACVSSLSLPKLTVTGLPAGLKYDAKTMKISGKATKPGVYTVTVKATNTSAAGKDAKTVSFKITVPNFECDALPKLNPETDFYVASVGVAISADFINCAPADGWTVKVAGLPTGLKYDAKSGTITGVSTAKAGSYTVTFTASKKGEPNQVATITLNVEPLPDWAVGTFYGYLYSKGYSGSGAGRTDYVTWETSDLVKIDVSSLGVVKVTGTYYDDGGRIGKDCRTGTLTHFDTANECIAFEWSYKERDGGPVTGIYLEAATGIIYRNVKLSEALGADIAEIEFECDCTDGWNDDDETFGFAQKNVFSMSSLGVELPDATGKTWTDRLDNVESTERGWKSVSGRLDFIFGAGGLVSPVWTPAGAGSRTKKLAQKTYLILDDFAAGVATCRVFVSAYDNADEERDYGFVYSLQISSTGDVFHADRERVVIHGLDD